ncbi:aminotransferase class III-fold pyridoxal phosphate-dependent enzyme [Phycisphaeraceae bacterium D3-23]
MHTTGTLQQLDHAHLWHPFTPMKQWRETPPLVIERGDGPYLFDTEGNRYIDGTSSLWCNIHGHRHPMIDAAVRDQLDKVAHSTLLGLTNPPAIEFTAKLVECINRRQPRPYPKDGQVRATSPTPHLLNKVFLSDAGATAVEAAFKMAVGYWYHHGKPEKNRFLGLEGAYHGDTVGSMSVGYSPLFHKPFVSMVFDIDTFPAPDALRPPEAIAQHKPPRSPQISSVGKWPSEDPNLQQQLLDHSITALEHHLQHHADTTAAIVIEPVMQGAAGMVCQPAGFLNAVGRLARKHNVLLICDEVAVGFGRTGSMFAFEHELDRPNETDGFHGPDILCLAKGISAGYLPLAATVTTDAIEHAFTGELHEKKTLFHGHTYTGNPLACAAGLASLDLFGEPTHDSPNLLTHINASADLIRTKLDALRGHPHILDIRQRGLMTGIELGTRQPDGSAAPFDFSKRTGYAICDHLRTQGLIIRPLGDVLVLMPIPATPHSVLEELLDQVVQTLLDWDF